MDEDRESQLSGHPEVHTSSQRRRKPLSCIVCRRRKLRCDRSSPCAQCVKSKTAGSCTYAGDQLGSTASTRRSGTPPRPRLQMANNRAIPSAGGLYVFDSKHKASSNRVSKPGDQNELHELRNRVQSLENALSLQGTILTPESSGGCGFSTIRPPLAPEDAFVRENIDAMPEKYLRGRNSRTRFVGRCHWTLPVSFFRDIGAFLEGHHKAGSMDSNTEAIKQFKAELWSRQRLSHQRAYQEQAFRLEELLPSRGVADELLRLYLTTFETTNRVLHIPTFLKEYQAYWSGSQSTGSVFVAKLLSLMAASSCFYNPTAKVNDKDSIRDAAAAWIMAVQSWIASVFVSPSIDFHMLQIKCLLMIACQANTVDGDVVWVSAGSLVRTAVAMGLHRDMHPFPNMSRFWAEMRRRLWATICELELQSSLGGGMLPSIDLDECDCGQPSDWDDEALSEEMAEYPAPKDLGSQLTRSSFQVMLARSLPVRFRILKLLNSLKFCLTYDEALRLTEELVLSMNEVLSLFNNGGSPVSVPGIEDTTFAKSFLLFLTRTYLLVLHQPFLVNVICSPKFSYSRKVCLESALEIYSQLEPSLPDRLETPHLGGLGGGMFRNESFRAAVTLCVEMSLQADEFQQSATGGTNNHSPLTDVVRSQQSVMLGAVERTIDMFGSLIKPDGKACRPFIFLTMALASVKARLSGQDPLRSVKEACEGAVRHCKELMGMAWTEGRPDGNGHPLETLPAGTVDMAPGGVDPSSDLSGFSPFGVGNVFDMYDYGMPGLWGSGFFTGF